MTRHTVACATLALITATPAAQTRPTFEVASIRASPAQPVGLTAGFRVTQRQVTGSFLSLRDYISTAYGLKIHQLIGPDWLGSSRFEIAATMPESATRDQVPAMLQGLLIERFKLQAHHESREFSVYALEVASGGLKLTRVLDDTPATAVTTVTAGGGPNGASIALGDGSTLSISNNRIEAKRVTMPTLADTLGRLMDRPVIDLTHTAGRYDVALDVTPEDYQAMLVRSAVVAGVTLPPQVMRALDMPYGGSAIDALRKVGLSLESRRAPIDVLVVDSIQRTPTEN